jgi:hypothetical protein
VEATQDPRFREDNRWARRCVEHLGGAEPAVTSARLRMLLNACLDFPVPGLGAAVLGVLPEPLTRQFIDRWSQELGGQRAVHAAVWGVYWADDRKLEKLCPRFAAKFGEFGSQLKPADRERWFADVQRALDPKLRPAWEELARPEPARSRRGHLFRGRGA